jgi:hypothetical protein
MSERTLRLGHLYPTLMNVYGDRGNIICLERRTRLRGIGLEVTPPEIGDRIDPGAFDLLFMGGAQDRDQRLVSGDLMATKAGALRQAVEDGVVFLGVCGGYQMAGRFYRGLDGEELPGAGVFDLYTLHPVPKAKRLIGNLAAEWEEAPGRKHTLAGFENHGGRTYLGPAARPFATVQYGYGNNGDDGTEGARYREAIGTYLHGSILPKNPALLDHLIAAALRHREGPGALPLAHLAADYAERAHAAAARVARRRSRRFERAPGAVPAGGAG